MTAGRSRCGKDAKLDGTKAVPAGAVINADAAEGLRSICDGAIDCCVTSPPYFGLRDYGVDGQIGLEDTPHEYVSRLVEVFREVRRVLKDDGTLWLNIGDSYAGSGRGWNVKPSIQSKASAMRGSKPSVPRGCKPKDLIGIPWMLAFALREDGWYLRQEIVWHKPNPMPESVTDRCTKSHESIFLLSKSPKYRFDAEAIKENASGTSSRPQRRRAVELAEAAGLTAEHIAAIRSAGITDSGKATVTQDGCGRNSERVAVLAAEAKDALGGYYREFLMAPKRNKRDVWTVPVRPFKGAHFATFPPELIRPCILAGCPEGGTVLDPFGGSGTTAVVAAETGRRYVLIELNPEYAEMARSRVAPIEAHAVIPL